MRTSASELAPPSASSADSTESFEEASLNFAEALLTIAAGAGGTFNGVNWSCLMGISAGGG